MAVSSLVQSYCIAHPTCGMESTVQRIIHSISSKLPTGCHTGEQFEEIKVNVTNNIINNSDKNVIVF